MKSDEQLMLEFQGGSSQAFEELFHRYKNSIYAFFRRRLSNAARAEELAQDTFIAILRAIERYEPHAKFRTYIYAIAIKQLWTERRSDIRAGRFAANPVDAPQTEDPTTALWIRDALEQLDTDHREVLMLREYEKLSY